MHDNPLNPGGTVISKLQGAADPIEIASRLMENEKKAGAKDKKQISLDGKKLNAINKLQNLFSTFQKVNNTLVNDTSRKNQQPNIFTNMVANMSPVNQIAAEHYITASAQDGANVLGNTYQLQVTQLASTDLVGSLSTIAGWNAALGISGTMNLSTVSTASALPATSPVGIAIEATDDLNTIVTKINNATGATGIRAYMTFQTPGGNPSLYLSAINVADPITVDESLLSAPLINQASVTPVLNLQSKFTVNGVDFVRNSNIISDAIDGVTITAKEVMPTATTLNFGLDTDKMYDTMVNWINSYNEIKSFLKEQSTKPAFNDDLKPGEDPDPNGEHALCDDPIAKKSLDMLNQIKSVVEGIFDKWDPNKTVYGGGNDVNNIKGLGVTFQDAKDPSSILIADGVALQSRIQQSPENFKKLMGQDFTSSNSYLNLLSFPSSLMKEYANKTFTLSISDISNGTFNATLTDGTTTETITGIKTTDKQMSFSSDSKFSGISLYYDNLITTDQTMTFKLTQGIASKLSQALDLYLRQPIDIDRLDAQSNLKMEDFKNLGSLSQRAFDIIRERKTLRSNIDKINERAEKNYITAIQQFNGTSKQNLRWQNAMSLFEDYDKKSG